ncbi:MAG: DUF3048 domain-containing protein [Actinomycetota bacterium]
MRRAVAALAALAVLATACGGGDDEPAEEVEETETATATDVETDDVDDEADDTTATTAPEIAEGPKAPFTGLAADDALLDQPAVVVKISNNDDNSLAALVGIELADVVIEERIEARATRFAAIFHSTIPDLVGPVRSARTTDIDLLTNLGNPILVFSGANLNVLRDLRELALDDGVVLVVDDGTGEYLFRDTDYRSPDNLFIDATVALGDFGGDAGAPDSIVSFRDAESDTRPASVDGSGVTVTGRDIVSFVYDDARGYVRVQDGLVHVTREGTPITVTNLVVMETQYVPNATDPESIDAITVGEGTVSVLIGGRRFEGTWTRDDPASPYEFRTDDGDEIVLEPGTTWITLVPEGSYEFGADAETQGLVLGSDE